MMKKLGVAVLLVLMLAVLMVRFDRLPFYDASSQIQTLDGRILRASGINNNDVLQYNINTDSAFYCFDINFLFPHHPRLLAWFLETGGDGDGVVLNFVVDADDVNLSSPVKIFIIRFQESTWLILNFNCSA